MKAYFYITRMLMLIISATVLYFPVTSYAKNDVLVVLSSNTNIYNELYVKLNEKLKYSYNINVTYADDFDKDTLSNHNLVIVTGTKAAKKLHKYKLPSPVLYSLVTKDFYDSTIGDGSCPGSACYGIYIEQPVHRYIRFISILFTNKVNIAIPITAASQDKYKQIQSIAGKFGLNTKKILVKPHNNITRLLRRKLKKDDILLALPDPDIYNKHSAKSIILTTYHMNTPIVAYSGAFSKAGAFASLFSSIDDITDQASVITNDILSQQYLEQKGYYPDNFSVEINNAVANSLRIDTPPLETIKRKMKQ